MRETWEDVVNIPIYVNISHNLLETLLNLFGDGYMAIAQIIDPILSI
jgi:hypothetical protein